MLQPLVRGAVALAALAIGLTSCGALSAAKSATAPTDPPTRPAPCAATAPTQVAANPWSQARAQLAPAGATALRLCRYAGLNARPPRVLVRSTLITSRNGVAGLVQAFDRLPTATGTFACPLDDGSEIVALLAYPRGRAVTITARLRGCQTVSNGDLLRTAAGTNGEPGPTLVAQLERLTP